MARDTEEILQEMLDNKDADSNLVSLDNSKLTSIWRLILYVVAQTINVFEQLFDLFRIEIQAKIDESFWGTATWYAQQAFKFQLDYEVEQLPDNEPYSVIDEDAQIIKFAAYSEDVGILNLKVAKDNGSGNPEELTPTELSQVEGYYKKIGAAGVITNVISLPADVFTFIVDVQYNPELSQATVKANIKAAIDEYFSSVVGFDGIVYKNKLVQYIESTAEGVVNIDTDNGVFTFTQGIQVTNIGTSYVMFAGYASYDEDNSTINFV